MIQINQLKISKRVVSKPTEDMRSLGLHAPHLNLGSALGLVICAPQANFFGGMFACEGVDFVILKPTHSAP